MPLSLVDPTPDLERLLDPAAELRELAGGFVFIEGPVWIPDGRFLLFSDIQDDTRWRWSEADGATVEMRPNFIGNGMALTADGELILCEHVTSSVVGLRPDGSRRVVAFHHQGTYLNSPNDVVVRSDGSVYFSDPDYGRWDHAVGVARKLELGFQGVFRVPPGGGETQLLVDRDEFEQPNGLCFSPDESILYIDDVHGIKAFDVAADGSLGGGRVFCPDMGARPGEPGDPDGMKCDEMGNVWCTGRSGVWVIAPSGEVLGIVAMPEVTANLAWGGPAGKTLFLCSATTLRAVDTLVAPAPLPGAASRGGWR